MPWEQSGQLFGYQCCQPLPPSCSSGHMAWHHGQWDPQARSIWRIPKNQAFTLFFRLPMGLRKCTNQYPVVKGAYKMQSRKDGPCQKRLLNDEKFPLPRFRFSCFIFQKFCFLTRFSRDSSRHQKAKLNHENLILPP